MLNINIVSHPLIDTKVGILRDENTPSQLFRTVVDELVSLLTYESTKEIAVIDVDIKTPVGIAKGKTLKTPLPVIVPIIRAGLGMLSGMMTMLPTAEVGFLGMKRDENTLQNVTYANRLPKDLTDRHCFILDPMLATGGTLVSAAKYLTDLGAKKITAICLLAAPEGIEHLKENLDANINFELIVPALDEKLNENGYIIPGLGDAGDRLYGVVD
jgi:uracil phosphoribosyltransferase